jgi:hypothetical protein
MIDRKQYLAEHLLLRTEETGDFIARTLVLELLKELYFEQGSGDQVSRTEILQSDCFMSD